MAIRLPKSKFLTKMIRTVDAPLISTSLNLSGETPLSAVSEIEKVFNAKSIDLVIDGGVIKNKKPSRILDVRDFENIKILRQ